MIRVSENITLKSIGKQSLMAIQSKGDYDYREVIIADNDGKSWFCVNTDKFLSVFSEGLTKVEQTPTSVTLFTKDGEYKLPILKERGLLMAKPEVVLPDEDPIKTWEYDFSGKSVNTKNYTLNYVSQASMQINIGENLVARNINAVLELYGDPNMAMLGITPDQYLALQKLGPCKISVYGGGQLKAENEGAEVRIQKTREKLDLMGVISRITSGEKLLKADLSSLKLKAMTKFIMERIYVTFRTGAITFVSEMAKKVFEVPDLVLPEPFTIEVWTKDLVYIFGEIEVYTMENKGRRLYIIKSTEKDKIAYLMTVEAKEKTW